jgi:DUF4097 and DUF4098 domain-containing protein YvlB
MTSFPTTGPITADVDLAWGDVTVLAAPGSATEVEVAPTDPSNDKDVKAAEDTTVTCTDGRLRVAGPRNRTGVLNKKYGSVQIQVRLASGSRLDVTTGMGAITASGSLGDCRAKTSAGDVQVEEVRDADLRTGLGAVVARDIAGVARCSTGSGSLDIGRIGGRAEVKNSNGSTRIGEAEDGLRAKSANGDIVVGRTVGEVTATTANGSLSVASAEQGSVTLRTSCGRVEVGIPEGTAALLDLRTSFGSVVNELETVAQPSAAERTLEVHAQTSAGDIVVRRAPGADAS